MTKGILEAGVKDGRFTRDEVESYKKIKAAFRDLGPASAESTRIRLTLAKDNATNDLKEKLAEINHTIETNHDATTRQLNQLQGGVSFLTKVAKGDLTECADDAPTVERIAQVNGAMVTLASEKRQLRIKEQDENKAKREADKKTAEDDRAAKKKREEEERSAKKREDEEKAAKKREEKAAEKAAKAAAKPKAKGGGSRARVQEPVV